MRRMTRCWHHLLWSTAALVFAGVHGAWTAPSRRDVIRNGLVSTGNAGLAWFLVDISDDESMSSIMMPPAPAHAARGAAELDLEFYVRDLVGGNKKEGNILPSALPNVPPPRTLKEPLVSWLLNDDCSADCLSTAALINQVQAYRARTGKASSSDNSSNAAKSIEVEIQESMKSYREKSSRFFYTKAPWKVERVSDQYYFDLTAYALWRTAADLLPNYADRDRFMRQLGQAIYDRALQEGLLKSADKSNIGRGLSATNDSVRELLQLFVSSQFCETYRLGNVDNKSSSSSSSTDLLLFDQLGDEALASGATVDALVSILEPATLGASLQITAEQSRFTPDFIGPTLVALWKTQLGGRAADDKSKPSSSSLKLTWETFFVDPVYRPNPKDYFPNEQLFQYSLTLQD